MSASRWASRHSPCQRPWQMSDSADWHALVDHSANFKWNLWDPLGELHRPFKVFPCKEAVYFTPVTTGGLPLWITSFSVNVTIPFSSTVPETLNNPFAGRPLNTGYQVVPSNLFPSRFVTKRIIGYGSYPGWWKMPCQTEESFKSGTGTRQSYYGY